ncbi:MAG: nitroreductase family protein [Salinibacter sp.]|uniref:nitroreductase family protein n=1 Tax=Salinibacter sp. TaxID=2065818 RepID=UPI0035D457ED
METLPALRPQKIADPDHDILDLFAERWSPRAFADRPVRPEKIRRMLEAARWTMSSYNEQPWRYAVASRHENADEYERLLHCLSDGNQEWARTAPVLMMSFYKTTFSHNGHENQAAPHDVGAASAALTFQATAMDLFVHQMAGIKKDVIRETYDVPDDFEPMAGLAVGYLGDPERLPDGRRDAERSPRSRKPLDGFVFGEDWDAPAALVTDE